MDCKNILSKTKVQSFEKLLCVVHAVIRVKQLGKPLNRFDFLVKFPHNTICKKTGEK